VHFAVDRFIHKKLIGEVWGRGLVDIGTLTDLPIGSTQRDQARIAARYLSKYVAKTFQDKTHPMGLHRYEVAQGFQPARQRIAGSTLGAVLIEAEERMGGAPRQRWESSQQPTWQGPPAFWVAW
jgi:hypothetical protein